MKARDVMVSPVITTSPHASVQDVAKTLIQHRISALPVLDHTGKLVGMISEGDLLHRVESNTERRRPWWLDALASSDTHALNYAKSHARRVSDLMTKNVITAAPDTPLYEIAAMLERHSIKRVPIVERGQLVGILSRANIVQVLATAGRKLEIELSDTAIRNNIVANLNALPWAKTNLLNVTVAGGVADIWGIARSDAERKAIRIAAENTAGVRAVNDNMKILPISLGA